MRVMFEVNGCYSLLQNVLISVVTIIAAAYTYYKTLTQGESLQRRGKADERNQTRRRRERLNRVSTNTVSGFFSGDGGGGGGGGGVVGNGGVIPRASYTTMADTL